MNVEVLTGEVGDFSWSLKFRYDNSWMGRMTCRCNGAAFPRMPNVILAAFAEVLRPRFEEAGLPLQRSSVGEGLTGDFSLSGKDGRAPTEPELAAVQTAIRDAFAEFMAAHPVEAKEIFEKVQVSARAWAASRKAQEMICRTWEIQTLLPELPRRICWRTAPDLQQMRLDLVTVFQDGTSKRSIAAACRRMQENLQLTQDARVMRKFSADLDRALELIDEKLGCHDGCRRGYLPDGNELHFDLLPSRRGHWKLELGLRDHSSETSKTAVLAARIGEISELRRIRGTLSWRSDLGPIGSMAEFRQAAWPVYAKVYRKLRAICLEVFTS